MLTDKCYLRIYINDVAEYAGPRHPALMWYGSLGGGITVEIANAGATLNTSQGVFAADGNCHSEKDGAQLATVANQVMDFARMKQAVSA